MVEKIPRVLLTFIRYLIILGPVWLLFQTSSVRCFTSADLQHMDVLLKNSSIYDFRIPPNDQDNLTNVHVALTVGSIWDISERSMDCKLDLYLTLLWVDILMANLSKTEIVLKDSNVISMMWRPGIFFSNSKAGTFHNVAEPNQLMLISPTGVIAFNRRYYLHVMCPMDLRKFPFDEQFCSVQISYINLKDAESLKWLNISDVPPIRILTQIKLPQFNLIDTEALYCRDDYANAENQTECLNAVIHFQRRFGFYLVNTYIPSAMIVVVSWTSFWMDIDAVPGRVALGITTLLTISSKASSIQEVAAEVSYVKAIDIWLMMCTGLVFLSLCEFVSANYLWRMNNLKTVKTKKRIADAEEGCETIDEIPNRRRIDMDKIARYVFPLVFGIFNIVYWIYYLG